MDKTLLKLAIKLIDLGWNVRFNSLNELVLDIKDMDRILLCIIPSKDKRCKYSILEPFSGKEFKVFHKNSLEKTLNAVFNIQYKNTIKNDLELLMAGEIQHIIDVQKQKNKPFTTVLSVEEEALLLALMQCSQEIQDCVFNYFENSSEAVIMDMFYATYAWSQEHDLIGKGTFYELYAMYDYYTLKLTEESFNNFVNSYLNGD